MKFQYGSGDTPLDGYKIKRGVGSGGFGEVYFAESDSGKEVALKRIQKNLDVEVRGVASLLDLRHPNLVSIYDIKFDKLEQGWIVMEYIDGRFFERSNGSISSRHEHRRYHAVFFLKSLRCCLSPRSRYRASRLETSQRFSRWAA